MSAPLPITILFPQYCVLYATPCCIQRGVEKVDNICAMKVTLEFDGHEEVEEYTTALNGWKYKALLFDFVQHIRMFEKGWDEKAVFDTDTVRDFIETKLNEYNISLD